MRPILRLLTASLVLACSAPALACDTEATATPSSTCIVTKRDGRTVVQFDLATADKLRQEHEAAPVIRGLLDQYRQHAANLSALADTRGAEAASLRMALSEAGPALEDARAEVEAANATWRSPWVWAPVGFVFGALATTALFVAVTR